MAKRPPVLIRHGCSNRSPRDFAECISKQGFGLIIHAFNATNDPAIPYRYSPASIERMKELMMEMMQLVEEGNIIELPHVADADFRRFMAKAGAE